MLIMQDTFEWHIEQNDLINRYIYIYTIQSTWLTNYEINKYKK